MSSSTMPMFSFFALLLAGARIARALPGGSDSWSSWSSIVGSSWGTDNGNGDGESGYCSSAGSSGGSGSSSSNSGSNDVCSPFASLLDDLQSNVFNGTCGVAATTCLRLSFHDAVGYSVSGAFQGGGADGSMIIYGDIELAYVANAGIDTAVNFLTPVMQRHPEVTAGDLIQFAAAVALTNCPGAPQIEFLAGRPNATEPASVGTVPIPFTDADVLLARMSDAGFSAEDTVALLASHSMAHAPTTDPSLTGANTGQLDTTPAEFDSEFFLEVLLDGVGYPGNGSNIISEVESALPSQNVVRLESDFALAHDNRTACTWQSYINNQELMTSAFKAAMAKMAVVGHDRSSLTDCSSYVPAAKALSTTSAYYPTGESASTVNKTCPSVFPSLSYASS